MTKSAVTRYNNIAISFHWLMALLIVGMLIGGKVMVSLDETSAIRFWMTQWHKTFGILILLLAVLRLLWRLSHRSPTHPENAPAWEHFAANVSHIVLYALLFIAPISGWMLVSVSPLNIDTFLFNVIPWPHLPWLTDLADKESAEHLLAEIHEIATGILIFLLLVHIAGALKHHLIDKDNVLTRMLPNREARTGRSMFGMLAALVLGSMVAVFGYSSMNPSVSLKAGDSAVSAIATVTGDLTTINFTESTVTTSLSEDAGAENSLEAVVNTAALASENQQVQSSLPDADWFNSDEYPQASFESTLIEAKGNGLFSVTGNLSIKGIDQTQQFDLQITDENGQKLAKGEFTIDRTSYQLGLDSQPNSEYVKNDVIIAFEFTLSQ